MELFSFKFNSIPLVLRAGFTNILRFVFMLLFAVGCLVLVFNMEEGFVKYYTVLPPPTTTTKKKHTQKQDTILQMYSLFNNPQNLRCNRSAGHDTPCNVGFLLKIPLSNTRHIL